MDNETLRLLLAQLHRELVANPPTDERSRQLLVALQGEIERSMSAAPSDRSAHEVFVETGNLRERVQEAMARFEGSHPQAAGALERVMTLLSNFGL